MVELTEEFFEALRPAKKFTDAECPTNSLDFDSSGEFLVTASTASDSIHLYNCMEGELRKVCHSKKYGVGEVKFAHRSSTILHTSTKGGDHSIRYLSLHDNKYLRYFTGHQSQVTQIHLSPLNDTFFTVAPTEGLFLWDMRTTNLQGRLNFTPMPSTQIADTSLASSAVAAFDHQGLVFAVATGSRYIRLYDARNWERGAFTTFEFTGLDPNSSTGFWTGLRFSPDGKEILIVTSAPPQSDTSPCPVGYGIDSFDGSIKNILEHSNQDAFGLGVSFHPNAVQYTPDSKYILGGRSDGRISIWNRTSPSCPASSTSSLYVNQQTSVNTSNLPVYNPIEGISRDPILALQFNPKYAMVAATGEASAVFYL